MPRQRNDDQRIARITFPTSSYTLERRQIEWLRSEAKRRDITASELLRDLLRRLMAETRSESEAA